MIVDDSEEKIWRAFFETLLEAAIVCKEPIWYAPLPGQGG